MKHTTLTNQRGSGRNRPGPLCCVEVQKYKPPSPKEPPKKVNQHLQQPATIAILGANAAGENARDAGQATAEVEA